MSHPAHPPRGGLRIAIGTGLLGLQRPAVRARGGALAGRRDRLAGRRRRAGGAADLAGARCRAPAASRLGRPSPAVRAAATSPSSREPSARMRALGRPEVSRGGLGVALVLAGGFAFLWANGAMRPAGEAVLAGLAVLVAVALIFAPSWRRLARSLAAERTERIRSQERADVGAHLHDSVLQTLALIQRSAEDPKQVAALARRQERELRGWLAGGDSREPGERARRRPGRRRPPRWRRRSAARSRSWPSATVRWTSAPALWWRPLARRCSTPRSSPARRRSRSTPSSPTSASRCSSAIAAPASIRGRAAGETRCARVDRRADAARRRQGGVRALPGGGTEVEIAIDRRDWP